MKWYYSHLPKVIVIKAFLLKIISTYVSTFLKFILDKFIKNNYLFFIFDSDPRTKIQRPQAGIKGLGFFNGRIYNYK